MAQSKIAGYLQGPQNPPSTTTMDVYKATEATSGKKQAMGTDRVENLDDAPPVVIPEKDKPAKKKEDSMYTDANVSDKKAAVEEKSAKKMAERIADMNNQEGSRAAKDATPVEVMDIAERDDRDKEDGLETSSITK